MQMRSVFFVGLIFLYACSETTTDRNKQGLHPIYDLAPFFADEAQRLEGLEISKTTEAEAEQVTKEADTIADGKAELTIFNALLLKGSPYQNSFVVDTVEMSYDAYLLTYLGTEEKCELKRMELFFAAGNLQYIYAVTKSANLFYDSESRFYYDIHKGYKVEGKDSFKWLKALDHSWAVKGYFQSAR
jgi:hypothetical protein